MKRKSIGKELLAFSLLLPIAVGAVPVLPYGTHLVTGSFRFQGTEPDSSVMACLFLGDESIMPVALDGSALTVKLDAAERKVTGSALNDTLFAFIARKAELDARVAELPRRESRMILDGMDHDEILRLLNTEAVVLSEQENALVSKFIKDNMHNCLGPGVFMIVTSNFPYPILNRLQHSEGICNRRFTHLYFIPFFYHTRRLKFHPVHHHAPILAGIDSNRTGLEDASRPKPFV